MKKKKDSLKENENYAECDENGDICFEVGLSTLVYIHLAEPRVRGDVGSGCSFLFSLFPSQHLLIARCTTYLHCTTTCTCSHQEYVIHVCYFWRAAVTGVTIENRY